MRGKASKMFTESGPANGATTAWRDQKNVRHTDLEHKPGDAQAEMWRGLGDSVNNRHCSYDAFILI
jgi:hypothetical protein